MTSQAGKIQTHRFQYATPANPADFNPADFVEKAVSWVKSLVRPGEKIALSASGGVDSTVAAFLLNRVVGKDLHAFFIEDGCRRLIEGKPEGEVTREIFSQLNCAVLEVRDEILPPLVGLSGGEEKRKTFIANYRKVSDRHISQLGASWIADGTIAPDIVETEGGFKSQHNVGWNYSVGKLEPLAPLAKPQVRRVGEYLDLPPSFTHRIPCPGPAQIVRTVGTFTEEKLRTGQLASDIIEQEIEKYYTKKHGSSYLYDEATGIRTPFQYFGVALDPEMEPDAALADLVRRTLGVTAECHRMASQTTVVPAQGTRPKDPIYKPVSWIKVAGGIDYDRLNALCAEAWSKLELPRILLELCANEAPKTKYLVGMRAVESAAARLAQPVRIDEAELRAMGRRIAAHTGAARVAYDISTKPPATIEFE